MYKIALIKGDGIGAEISNEAVKVLKEIGTLYNHDFQIVEVCGAGESVDKYGDPLTEENLEKCVNSDAILIGNIGGSKWDNIDLDKKPVKAILRLRKAINATSNLRPIVLNQNLKSLSPLKEEAISKGLDILVVRDLAGSVICGEKHTDVGEFGRESSDLEYYNEQIIKRSAKRAFEIARERRNLVSSIDKSNVLASSMLWKEVVTEVSKDYPNVKLDYHLVDAAAMEVIMHPEKFDVIVTTNMFGDILADELSELTGSACMLASAELNVDGKGIYTPNQLHFPDESIINKDKANPIGLISSVALMLKFSLNLNEEAEIIEKAIERVMDKGYRTEDIKTKDSVVIGTKRMGDEICNCIKEIASQNLNKAAV